MVKTFYAVDDEFAVATGSNVNDAPGTSTFDYPPSGTKDFVISSSSGDSDPNEFAVGDTYDLSWDGTGGGGTIEDAVVIRSDSLPGEGGAIIFEGLDEAGDLVQVIWSPDFDLDGWYWANFSGGASPGFYTTDQNSSYTHSVVCFSEETPILTGTGERPAGSISSGQLVWTLDAGFQPVIWVGHQTVRGVGPSAPVIFAAGAVGNDDRLVLSQQHRVLVRSPLAELFFANHEVLVSAKAMIGEGGVTTRQVSEITYVHLLLQDHHILKAAGALCESLFMGDQADIITAAQMRVEHHHPMQRVNHRAARPMLTYRESRSIMGARQQATLQPAM